MTVLLWIFAVINVIGGLLIFITAKGAVHEILAMILWLMATVAVVGASVLLALHNIGVDLVAIRRLLAEPAKPADRAPLEGAPE